MNLLAAASCKSKEKATIPVGPDRGCREDQDRMSNESGDAASLGESSAFDATESEAMKGTQRLGDSGSSASLASTRATPRRRISKPDSMGAESLPGEDGVSVLCVGVMRTGLITLHKALRSLGYSHIYDQEDIVSTHDLWDDVLRNRATKETFEQIFRGAEVVMGMPTFCFWEEILKLYPNARVILTVRDEDDWWESVRYAKTLMDRDLPGAPLRYGVAMRKVEQFLMPSYHKFCEVLRFAWATTLGSRALATNELNEAAARSSYRRHNSYVKSCFRGRTTVNGEPQLLVYDVREGWEPLCNFFGKDVPEVEFPSELSVPYFPGHHEGGSGASKRACEERPARPADAGHEMEDLLVPDSDFGARIRMELRRGLGLCLATLTLVAGACGAVHATEVVRIPVGIVGLIYLVMAVAAWNAYLVVHGLVMRVPALVVLPMTMKSLLIAGALNACLISFGIFKEMLVTQDSIAAPVLVLAARLVSVIFGAVFMLITEGSISFGAPLSSMAAFVCTNEASTWAGYEMLKYVSFPVCVMAKSCTMLPNMIMGRVLNGTRHSTFEYAQALLALVCVAVMHLAGGDSHKGGEVDKSNSPVDASEVDNFYTNLLIGVLLLMFFFACDSFTSQWQTALYKSHPRLSQTQMMLGGNVIGFALAAGTCLLSWGRVSDSFLAIAQHPEVAGRVLGLGVCGALGQCCIYGAIRVLGPLSFTWIMTGRQLLSVLISLVFFGHGVCITKLLCIAVVFAVMSARQLRRVMPKQLPCRRADRSIEGISGTLGIPPPRLPPTHSAALGAEDGPTMRRRAHGRSEQAS